MPSLFFFLFSSPPFFFFFFFLFSSSPPFFFFLSGSKTDIFFHLTHSCSHPKLPHPSRVLQ